MVPGTGSDPERGAAAAGQQDSREPGESPQQSGNK